MMDTNSSLATPLIGSEIHGFHTMSDLDVNGMMEEAKTRWLRPNEIHAILCNNKHFSINVKPVNLPKSGRIVLFDRKMLRNFRKDGHNWKKKKDGKTVKEAHEHLKVGNDERIHVYYAHGQDNPTFVRRCYWLLDKSMEHIVLVHYRETQEVQGSPATPGISNSSSGAGPLSEESDSTFDRPYYVGTVANLDRRDSMTIKNHEQRLHEINTLEWDELLGPDDSQELITQPDGNLAGFGQLSQQLMNGNRVYGYRPSDKVYKESSGNGIPVQGVPSETINYDTSCNIPYQTINQGPIISSQNMNPVSSLLGDNDSLLNLDGNVLGTQDSFGRWMTCATTDFPGPADNRALEASITSEHQPSTSPVMSNQQRLAAGQIFNITDISPAWALSTEETKILVVGFSNEGQLQHSELYLACGDSVFPVVHTQVGVYRCLISPQLPGPVNLYLTLDGHEPISQVVTFEFRAPIVSERNSLENKSNWEEFQLQMRLAHLLFSSKSLSVFHNKFSPNALKDAKAFTQKTSHIAGRWSHLTKMIGATKLSCPQAKDCLFELILQNRLQEWLLEQVVTGCKITERDEHGQGVIHLCAILGYTWAVYPYSCSGLSLDYRDKRGWTALHWAAYYGREKMVASLLSTGAKPNLVTDPTPENPGGCHAADLASKNGYDGLSAYLAEKALVAQFNDMTLAGNVSGSLQTTTNDPINVGNFNEDEMYLKDTLAAYRTAADAAARIQTAFREHSLNVRTQIVESSNPETEARNIVAAMKIQHAFRDYDTRKKIAAAARIQYRFRTWKIRKDFLNLRRQAIKLQSVFRGFQVRRQYRKICWSVGVLEKAVLRWRLKRKGFRGLQQPVVTVDDSNQESDAEEDFFVASRKQAEERVERSVVRVQAMFRSRRAQEEYRRMKMEHSQAMLELEELAYPDINMGSTKY